MQDIRSARSATFCFRWNLSSLVTAAYLCLGIKLDPARIWQEMQGEGLRNARRSEVEGARMVAIAM